MGITNNGKRLLYENKMFFYGIHNGLTLGRKMDTTEANLLPWQKSRKNVPDPTPKSDFDPSMYTGMEPL